MADSLYKLSDSTYGGKKMVSEYELGNDYFLIVTTMKRSNGMLCTTASQQHLKDGFLTHRVYHDFNKTYVAEQGVRATAKAIEAQHRSVDIEQVKAECEKYCALRDAKATVTDEAQGDKTI